MGDRQPQVRGRPDRAGAGPDRRPPALRRLRPARRRGADPARGAGPAAGRRAGDALRHLPGPAAAADPDAGRGGLPRGLGRRAGRDELRPQQRAPPPAGARLRPRDGGPARLRQRRRRLRLERQPPHRQRLLERRATSWPRPTSAASASPTAGTGTPVRQAELLQSALKGVRLAYQNLESVELGVTTIDHYFDSLGGITRAVGRAGRRGGAGLHRRPDPRRGQGPHAGRAGGARDPHPDAEPQVVRGHAAARLRGRARRSRPTSPTRSAGRPPRARWRPGSTSRSRRPSSSTPRCASGWRR